MTIPSIDRPSELNAINEVLAAIGQAPVTTVDQTNPDVSIIQQTLANVSREVQSEGWHFNKESSYKLTPQADKTIPIPDNMLSLDLDAKYYGAKDVVRRNGKLYDKWREPRELAYTFDSPVYVDVIWFTEYSDIPTPIQDYIVARTAALVSTRIVGDATQYQILQARELNKRANALEYDCNSADYTYFGHPRGDNSYNPYQPYRALYR
tara:strand:- start:2505 stop:3128 length:624 start_codon:yes stop_codon:yes gene_type:complete